MPTAIGPTRQDTFRVTLTVDGVPWGVWDTRSGGKTSANQIKTKSGDIDTDISLGGIPTTDNVVISRLYRIERDHDTAMRLQSRIGRARCVVQQDPKDADGNPRGKPIVWTGVLDSLEFPSHDKNNNGRADITLEISPDGGPVI